MKYLRNKRGLAGLGALAAVLGVTLWVVVPALATGATSYPYVEDPSGAYLVPADVPYGGNGDCSNLFPTVSGLSGVKPYHNSNPQDTSGAYLPSGNTDSSGQPDGAGFSLSFGGHKKAETLTVTAQNATILGIGINGGTDTTVYDYTGLDYAVLPGSLTTSSGPYDTGSSYVAGTGVTTDSGLHAPASSGKYTTVTGTDGTTTYTVEEPTQYSSISQLSICYEQLATISGTAFTDLGGDGSQGSGDTGIPELAVTVSSGTTTVATTTTAPLTATTPGSYAVAVPVGGTYNVCIQKPTNTTQTDPTSSSTYPPPLSAYTCTATGQAGNGYTVTNPGSGGVSGLNFGFEPYGTVSGYVYQDYQSGTQEPDGAYSNPPDTSLLGTSSPWSVHLFDNSAEVTGYPVTIDATGKYTFSLPFNTGDTYTVCESKSSSATGWAQDQPLAPVAPATDPNYFGSCNSGGPLPSGYQFVPTSGDEDVNAALGSRSLDFGNVSGGVLCDTTTNTVSPPNTVSPTGSDITDITGINLDCSNKSNTLFFFNQSTDPAHQWVSVWGTGTDAPVPMFEAVEFSDPFTNGTPAYAGLAYDDTFPFDVNTGTGMPYCKENPGWDPSAPAPPDSTIAEGDVLPGSATSCIISLTIQVTGPANTSGVATGKLDAVIYSSIDGFTSPS